MLALSYYFMAFNYQDGGAIHISLRKLDKTGTVPLPQPKTAIVSA